MRAACPECKRDVTVNSRGARSHTDPETGKLCPRRQIIGTTALKGPYVIVEFNTDAEGNWVECDELPYEDIPRCIYGPFEDDKAADHWMSHEYPLDDTDVYDMYSFMPDDPLALGYVNHPDVVKPREIHAS